MSVYKISEMTWNEFDERRKTIHTVIIPSGAIESYGPHLPLGTDIKVAEKLAELVAEKTGAFVAPSLSVGDSKSISMFPGTLCVRPESFKEYLRDMIDSLRKWGIQNFLFINGHAGNVPMISQLSNEYMLSDSNLRLAQIDWWRYAQTNSASILENSGYMAHGHASECGTSVMMYLFPQCVRSEKLSCAQPKVVNAKRFPGIIRYTPFCEFSDAGMIGDALSSSAEKGEKIVLACVEKIIAYMQADFTKF